MNEEFYEEIVKEASPDNGPFSGFGRPFNDDPLAAPDYSGGSDVNPNAATGPYTGQTDTSINNVGPYTRPITDNPAQNIDTEYNPPGFSPFDQEESQPELRTAYQRFAASTNWFDGTSASIYDRIVEAQYVQRLATDAGDDSTEENLEEQINQLRTIAAEYDNANLEEYVSSLPGGTVALEYDDLTDGGLVDLGIDDGSWMYSEAKKIASEAETYDWDKFSQDGAARWVDDKRTENPGVLLHELVTRQSAIDYVKDKTMVLMDPIKRADVIDSFVSSVERFRREAALDIEAITKTRERDRRRVEALQMHREVKLAYEDYDKPKTPADRFLDKAGLLAIGEDDGSALYREARQVLSDSEAQDWDEFISTGAEQWVIDRATDSPGMFNHTDITSQAAKDFAYEKTSMLFDAQLRGEVISRFATAVEQNRQSFLKFQARKEAAISKESSKEDVLQQILGESDLLW